MVSPSPPSLSLRTVGPAGLFWFQHAHSLAYCLASANDQKYSKGCTQFRHKSKIVYNLWKWFMYVLSRTLRSCGNPRGNFNNNFISTFHFAFSTHCEAFFNLCPNKTNNSRGSSCSHLLLLPLLLLHLLSQPYFLSALFRELFGCFIFGFFFFLLHCFLDTIWVTTFVLRLKLRLEGEAESNYYCRVYKN